MANKFNITIEAVDKATAVVRKVNKHIAGITAPIRQMRASVSSLGREAGLHRFGQKLAKVGRSAKNVFDHVSSLAAPMAAVVGVGTLTGIAMLSRDWAKLGWQTSITARTIGVSATSLQALQGAARMAGVSAASLTGDLGSLGTTLEDALYGRNQGAMMMLNRLGISIHKTASGAVDSTRAFMDLSRSIAGIKNPQAQALVARTFGLEQVLPLLRQGPAAIQAYEAKVRELGGVQAGPALLAAQKFGIQLTFLDVAIKGLKNAIGVKLIPVLRPLVAEFTSWIAVNRQLIATNIAHFARGFAQAVQSINWKSVLAGIAQFFAGIKSVVHFLGGWKNAVIALAVVMNASLIVSVIKLGTSLATVAGGALNLLTVGLGAAGVKASALVASMGKLSAVAGAGLAGYEIGKHVVDPMINAGLSKATGHKDTTLGNWTYGLFNGHYNPNAPDNGREQLAAMRARDHIQAPAHHAQVITSMMARALLGSGMGAPQQHQVTVDVNLHNAPVGTTASAHATGRADVRPPRISHAMMSPAG